MARAPNENIDKAYKLYKKGLKLVEIASQLNVPDSTVRRWKSTYKWDSEQCERSFKNNERSEKKKAPKKRAVAKEVESVLENAELTDKQRLFCLYQVKYFNATKAYQKAYGCSYNTAMVEGCNLLRNPKIKEEIDKLKQVKLNQAMLEPSDIFQKYMDIAFADITDYLEFRQEEVQVMGAFGPLFIKDEDTGEETPITKIVNVVKFKDSNNVDGSILAEVKQGRDGASIKLNDRMKALEWLTEHMNMATEEQKLKFQKFKLDIAKLENPEEEPTESDGFIEALQGKVDEVWQEE